VLEHHYCFVCSSDNEKGLKVCFKQNNGRIEGTFTPEKAHQSYKGITHGGVLASLLDAAMNRAVLEEGLTARTGRLEIRFWQSTRIGSPLKVVGEVMKMRKKFALAKGEVFSSDDERIASSRGIFLTSPKR
jgi:uncharacterized protein (TIGR00369 family)